MIKTGQINSLKVIKKFNHKYFLNGEELGQLEAPETPGIENYKPGDSVKVFVYKNRESHIVASLQLPAALPGECALLKVVSFNSSGTFLDWGLSSDLFVPYSEQKIEMKEGNSYVVYILQNMEKGNIIGSSKIEKYMNKVPVRYSEGDKVNLMVYGSTDTAYKAVINNLHTGLLYKNEVFQPITSGLKIKGFIKKIREDNKIDLSLEKPGFTKVVSISEKILIFLNQNNGILHLTDKSDPEEINSLFGVSKSTYKKAIGTLYKKKLIHIGDNEIRLIK
jgi:predicted RNA-binding protein (virulence factor B family)